MKTRIIFFFIFCVTIKFASAQETDSISLDLLKAPASVAFNLLGIAPSDIERPTDLTSFALSVRNSTSNFTKFPSSYAGEFAPGWLSRKPNLTLDHFNSKKFNDVFWQTFSVSFGLSRQNVDGEESDDSSSFTRTGLGVKFSIIRPKWTGKTQELYQEIITLQQHVLSGLTPVLVARQQSNTELQGLRSERARVAADVTLTQEQKLERMKVIDADITKKLDEIKTRLLSQTLDTMAAYGQLTRQASSFKVERTGAFLDFAAGFVVDFPDNRFDNSQMSKAGAWLTGGYEGGNKNISVLGIVRYLHQPDKIFADDAGILRSDDLATADGGIRLVIKGANGKFNAGSEAIYRSVLNNDFIDPSWRLVFNAEYDIRLNKKLTFAFGRNFDKTVTRGGNLVAALNFISGFGSKRKLK